MNKMSLSPSSQSQGSNRSAFPARVQAAIPTRIAPTFATPLTRGARPSYLTPWTLPARPHNAALMKSYFKALRAAELAEWEAADHRSRPTNS